MSPAWFFGVAAAINVVSVALLVWTTRERRRITELRDHYARAGKPLTAASIDEATRRLRR